MKFKKLLYTVLLSAGCLSASAQAPETVTVDAFNHHWYVQAQAGAQYTLGEVCFGDLISPNVQVAGGYQFTPVWGLRLAVDAWQSKGGFQSITTPTQNKYTWKWYYVAPSFDVTCDLVNLIAGYKADRVFNCGILAGVGANIFFSNGEAQTANGQIVREQLAAGNNPANPFLEKLWDGTVPVSWVALVHMQTSVSPEEFLWAWK